MSRFFLVRHGETIWHHGNRYAGSTDIPLTPLGHEQAQKLARWAATARLTHLYASSMQRAIATATPSSEATGLAINIEPRIREIGFGRAEGMTSDEMKAAFPEERAAFLRDPAANFLPGGEDPREVVARASAGFADIAAACGNDARILVVAHNTMLRLMMCHWLGAPLSEYRRMFPALDNVAITEVEIRADRFSLYRFNVPAAALA